jgi:hypothetical protein
MTMIAAARNKATPLAARALAAYMGPSAAAGATRSMYIPRVTERRAEEEGPGGRSSNAGVTVAVFGASGFLGRYVCSNCGTCVIVVSPFSPRGAVWESHVLFG